MLSHIKFSIDVVIISTFAFVTLLGLALGQERLRYFALTVYVGLVLAYELGGAATGFVNGHGQSFDTGTVNLVLFLAPILLMAFAKHSKSKVKHSSTIMTLVIGVLLSCLIVASALHLMDGKAAANYLNTSQIAVQVFNLRLVWLAAVPIAIILGIIIKPKNSH